ncbi:MAG: PEP-utilizing enzyme [Acidimicrobiia bacterium]|nr:PEP-utilizing enzyme [Acidimicrobiia bacterium]
MAENTIERAAPRVTELTGLAEPALLGGKGAALDRLVGWGVTVPRTGVVTTAAYREAARHEPAAGLVAELRAGGQADAQSVDAAFLATPLGDELSREITELARLIGEGQPLAVRSSATVEDLHESSFAGQYHSELDVDPAQPDDVVRAVKLVWASLWHPAPRAYRAAFGIDDADVAMAVVVMRMVPATEAGVVFTVDPGGGAGMARVEAVLGLGEALVSGAVTPRAWVLPRSRPADAGTDPPPLIRRALDAALEVERRTGVPQDVEWAADGETLWVVQARPITVSATGEGDGFDTPVDDHELTPAGIGEMLPGVLAPLVWELNSFVVEEALRALLDDLGALPSGIVGPRQLVRRVRGRAAQDLARLLDIAESLPGGAPESVESEYFGSRRPGRPATAPPAPDQGTLRSMVHDLRVLAARRQAILGAETAITAANAVAAARPALGELGEDALLAYQARLVDLAARTVLAELVVAAAGAAAYRRLEQRIAALLGPAEAGRWMLRVTVGAATLPPPPRDSSAAVFAGPTWRELDLVPPAAARRPETDASAGGASRDDASAGGASRELERTLTALPKWRRTRILTGQVVDVRRRLVRRELAEVREQLGRRERTKRALAILGGEVRRVHVELGRRLASAGALRSADEVSLLSVAELRDAALRRWVPPPYLLARRRRWVDSYRAERPLPARFVGRPEPGPVAIPAGDRLEGWAAAPGKGTGVARVVTAPTGHLAPGEILVAEATDASWSPLFVEAGGIVVERGGPLSHAAILARELGVPAVLNVAGAARALDGRTVTVDGDEGVVHVHEEAPVVS